MKTGPLTFGVGDVAEVRSPSEIAATLDHQGTLGGLPFMPEMIAFCGRRFRITRRVFKTCIEGQGFSRFPRDDVYVLEDLRCSGRGHDTCERGCLLYWKAAWLKPVESGLTQEQATVFPDGSPAGGSDGPPNCAPARVAERYFCQATSLGQATRPIGLAQRALTASAEYRSGNYPLHQIIRWFMVPVWEKLRDKATILLRRSRAKASTPDEALGLNAGDWVEVRPFGEIARTLDGRNCNRGLRFTRYMRRYCGHRFKVRSRIHRMILDDTGQMRELRNTVILDGAVCEEHYCFGGCPRRQHQLWREIWLRRVRDT